jgi:hypothetical protein
VNGIRKKMHSFISLSLYFFLSFFLSPSNSAVRFAAVSAFADLDKVYDDVMIDALAFALKNDSNGYEMLLAFFLFLSFYIFFYNFSTVKLVWRPSECYMNWASSMTKYWMLFLLHGRKMNGSKRKKKERKKRLIHHFCPCFFSSFDLEKFVSIV